MSQAAAQQPSRKKAVISLLVLLALTCIIVFTFKDHWAEITAALAQLSVWQVLAVLAVGLSYPLLEGCVAWVIVRSRIPGFRLWQGIDTAWCGTFGNVVTLGAGAVPVHYLYKKGEYNPENEHSFSPSFCNRLDRNTSGIIIGAKNAAALRIINEKIRSREIKKIYLCIVEGHLKKSGHLTAYLTRGDKKVTVSDYNEENSKKIGTKYNVIAEKKDTSLVEVELETGRTHQIRAQFSHIGNPLYGDTKYGSRHSGGMNLASYKLIFDFKTDAGILNYLNHKEFKISVDFAKTFAQQKL